MIKKALLYPLLALAPCLTTIGSGAHAQVADTFFYTQTFCSSQFVIVNNHLYDPGNPSGVEIIPGGAANGQDSVIVVNLSFNEPVEVDFFTTLCEFDTLLINGIPYHTGHFEDTEVFENGAANGCDSIVNILIDFVPSPFSYFYDTICPSDSVVINGVRYDFDNRSGVEVLQDASYLFCDSLVYVSLSFLEPWVYLGPDRQIIEGDTICLNFDSQFGAQDVIWNPPPPDCNQSPCLRFCSDTLLSGLTYTVTLIDTMGCVTTDDLSVTVTDDHVVYAPNVFKYNAGEPNDRFFLRADPGVWQVNQLVIYDRWGEPVFKARDVPNTFAAYDMGWDGVWKGKPLEPGVYFWWAELLIFNGKTIVRNGDVTIVR